MFGSLVISSRGTPNLLDRMPMFDVGTFGNSANRQGGHIPGRHNGWWTMNDSDCESFTGYLPQRDKHMQISQRGGSTDWESIIAKIDSEPGPQLTKLNVLRDQLDDDVEFAVINTEGDHGSFSLIPRSTSLSLVGVENGKTIQLAWSDGDYLIEEIRKYYPAQLSLFRFPKVVDPVFIHTQAVCSKWYRWNTSFGGDTFRCFNCLEVMLFQGRNRGHS